MAGSSTFHRSEESKGKGDVTVVKSLASMRLKIVNFAQKLRIVGEPTTNYNENYFLDSLFCQ